MHIHTKKFTQTHTHIKTYTCTQKHTHTHTHSHSHSHTQIQTHKQTHTHKHTHLLTNTYKDWKTHTYTQTSTYTNILTLTLTQKHIHAHPKLSHKWTHTHKYLHKQAKNTQMKIFKQIYNINNPKHTLKLKPNNYRNKNYQLTKKSFIIWSHTHTLLDLFIYSQSQTHKNVHQKYIKIVIEIITKAQTQKTYMIIKTHNNTNTTLLSQRKLITHPITNKSTSI